MYATLQPQRVAAYRFQPKRSRSHQCRTTNKSTPILASIIQLDIEGSVVLTPKRRPPKAIIQFLGGAFAGATPNVFYEILIERLAQHYTIISTPYPVSFQHGQTAIACYESFQNTLQKLRNDPTTAAFVPSRLPIVGIGHSNGALLHMLMGSLCSPTNTTTNIIISFNNKEVDGGAVPIPIDVLQGAIKTIRTDNASLEDLASSNLQTAFSNLLTAVKVASGGSSDITTPEIRELEYSIQRILPFGIQLGSVLDEISDGGDVVFSPTPSETKEIIRQSYTVPRTLLVRFSDDSIDETVELYELLRQSLQPGREVYDLLLEGNHLTPVGPQVKWQVQRSFSPLDAVAQALVQTTRRDVNTLADNIIAFLDG